jgi:hypothetical protein
MKPKLRLISHGTKTSKKETARLVKAGTFVNGTTFAHRVGWYVHPDTKGQQRRMR